MRSPPIILLALILLTANIVSWQIIFDANQRTAKLAFLDVGQGTSVLIVGPRTIILYDTGSSGRQTSNELAAVLPPHRRRIDLLLLSHADRDHYGGAFELLRRYQVGLILTNTVPARDPGWQELLQLARAQGVPLRPVQSGTSITTPTETIAVIHPQAKRLFASGRGKRRDFDNPNSIVLNLKQTRSNTSQPVTALLTGDIDAAVEHYLVQHYPLASDYLLIPHHGSRFSSSAEFLRAVQPRLAIIQVGQRNRYGHPTEEVLARLDALNLPFWRTDRSGRLIIK